LAPELRDLVEHPEQIPALSPDVIPRILGELEVLRAGLLVRLITHPATATPPGGANTKSQPLDRLLSPTEAAALLKVTTRWLYRHHRSLPFTKRLSRRALRFSEEGLRRWLAHRHG